MQFYQYNFSPKLIPTLVTLAAITVMIMLGQWQSSKATQKQSMQDTYDARTTQMAERITSDELDAETLTYKKVVVSGSYETQFQILLDNRVQDDKAGYHVITPFRINGSERYILINRGWVPLGADRAVLPEIKTPYGMIELSGVAMLPPSKLYELEQPESLDSGWQIVWQNMDLVRLRKAVPFSLQPLIIQLDQTSPGGFVRNWTRPDDRVATHMGYAFQWYGMAVMLALFYFFVNIKKNLMTTLTKPDKQELNHK